MPELTDSQLVQQYHDGDTAALGTLLERHQSRVYHTILRMVSHPDDAAEVAQDTMVKVIENIEKFRGDAKFSTWITRIAMNQAVSRLRRRKIRRTTSLDAAPVGMERENPSSLGANLSDDRELTPDERVEQSENLSLIHQALDRLDEPYRAVLVLRDLNEIDYDQIAETLDIALGTVKSRLFRARLALREELRRLENAPADDASRATHPG